MYIYININYTNKKTYNVSSKISIDYYLYSVPVKTCFHVLLQNTFRKGKLCKPRDLHLEIQHISVHLQLWQIWTTDPRCFHSPVGLPNIGKTMGSPQMITATTMRNQISYIYSIGISNDVLQLRICDFQKRHQKIHENQVYNSIIQYLIVYAYKPGIHIWSEDSSAMASFMCHLSPPHRVQPLEVSWCNGRPLKIGRPHMMDTYGLV